jgi:hypothetical protein
MQHNLSKNVLVSQEVTHRSITGGAVNGAGVDMQGWDGVMFIVDLDAVTGSGTLDARVVRDDNSGFNSATNISGAALTQMVNANTAGIIDVYRPSERYVRAVITQAANTVIAGVTAVRYRRTGILPPTQSAAEVVVVAES